MSKDNKEKIKEIIKRSNQFIVLCGPSGSGKTMVINHLVNNYEFFDPPFLTTRELRPGEKEHGSIRMSRDEFITKEMDGQVFLSVRNYGNAYGYDLNIIFNSVMDRKNIIIETPASNLITDISYFLPKSIIIGIIPLTLEEIKNQLGQRDLSGPNDKNNNKQQRIRLLNYEIEKEHIAYCCGLIDINIIIPTYGCPENTLIQVDRLMDKKWVKARK